MKRSQILMIAGAAFLLAACGEETRNGQLTLSGSTPLKIADQGGQIVEFYSGPLKVVFAADSSRKFTVNLEQNGRKAKFSGAANVSDWNFTVHGKDIGQPADFTSNRNVAMYGPVEKRWGMGGPCGFNGQWETDEDWQRGKEDWKVSFNDAATGGAIGTFASQLDQYYLIASRNIWCRERPNHEPHGPIHRVSEVSKSIKDLDTASVKFD